MKLHRLLALTIIVPNLLAACATTIQQPATASAQPMRGKNHQQQLQMQLASGLYRCELGQHIDVQRGAKSSRLIELNWQGTRHTLQRQDSNSGLPRYEDQQNGLLWIDLPWKSVLIDVKTERPLANDCKPTQDRETRS